MTYQNAFTSTFCSNRAQATNMEKYMHSRQGLVYIKTLDPMMVCCAGSCYPFMTWRDTNKCLFEYPKSPTKYRYLNSGMIMG